MRGFPPLPQAIEERTPAAAMVGGFPPPIEPYRAVLSEQDIADHFPTCCVGEGMTCAICLSAIHKQDLCRKTSCNHIFHAECIMKWWTREVGNLLCCPLCRERQRVFVKKKYPKAKRQKARSSQMRGPMLDVYSQQSLQASRGRRQAEHLVVLGLTVPFSGWY